MPAPRVVFDRVWKEFRRGERHDALRDVIPAAFRRLRGQGREASDDRTFWALSDISFEVQAGQALGVIGRNGAGKSTLLKLLTRILKPTRGTCAVRGRAGALIEIAAGFHPDLTGRENVYLQGAIMGMRRSDIAVRFDEIVAFAGVERFIDTPVKRYSSGMNARLGFAIAAHLNPDVLLIDEVLSVGDMAFQEKCQAQMKRFRDEGVAIVFVSHHLPAIAQLCDRVLLLDGGKPVCLGSPSSVIAEYCGGCRATSDHDDVRIDARLRNASALRPADTFEVEPGAPLEVEVTVEFRVDTVQAAIGLVVWDLTRELYVYGASSEFVGVPPIRARRGDVRTFTFAFEAHLTRGLYAIEINVADHDRQRFLGVARGIRHFNVVEQVSYDGVANLYLTGREGLEARVRRDIGPRLAASRD
jgi:homopolymeric O-antigen transport system ATP-binding protein